jgi:carboxymethylenebutenolidase
MAARTAKDFHPEVLRLFDLYVHGLTSRRGFLDGVAKFAAGAVGAAALLDALNPRFAEAQQIAGDDPRITTGYIDYASPDGSGTIHAYLAKPAHPNKKLGAVLVVHENRGLNPHIEDIARRLAVDNFIALAPDALTPLGGYPGDEDKARELFPKLDQGKTHNDFIAAIGALKALPEGNGKVGVVGFCYGGGIANFLATKARFPFTALSRLRRTLPKSRRHYLFIMPARTTA